MKPPLKNRFWILALLAVHCVVPAAHSTQLYSNFYTFTMLSVPYTGTNVDGSFVEAGLLLSSNTLYGTTYYGGSSAKGTVYRVNINGGSFTNLHNFSAGTNDSLNVFTNSDGANGLAGLILSGNKLYGTTPYGGTGGRGTVFRVNTDGTGFTNLHSFSSLLPPYYTNSEGANPQAALVLSGNTLYGTAEYGGSNAQGAVFQINTDGSGFKPLCSLTGFKDGSTPMGSLLLAGDTLYGTSSSGGNYISGAVFKVNTNGLGLTNVYTFSATGDSVYTNSDGAEPQCTLILSGSTLYGTTAGGGTAGMGTVFSVNTNGTGFASLHTFTGADGEGPFAGVTLLGNTLYGTTYMGGISGHGVIFRLGTNGIYFKDLHDITGSDGAFLYGGLTASSNTLYGAASEGTALASGALFQVLIEPPLNITRAGTNVLLAWSTNFPGFTLQSATNLASPSSWSLVTPVPAVVNGQETVTNGITPTRKFYRLSE